MLENKSTLIYALDDERHIRELLSYNLEAEGFTVETFETAEEFWFAMRTITPDLILLDIMLNDANGMDICKRLRTMEASKATPVIMLTAKNEEMDRILGLEMGADDYVTKPFSIRELITRVKVQLRKAEKEQVAAVSEMKIGDLEIYIERHEILYKGQHVELTPKEFDLLVLLAKNVGKPLTREFIISTIWGYDYIGEETRTIDVHIRQIRKQLDDTNEELIKTIRGIGYCIKASE